MVEKRKDLDRLSHFGPRRGLHPWQENPMTPRTEYTHLVALHDPQSSTHAASHCRGHWKTICGRELDEACVINIATYGDDDLLPSCKRCQRTLTGYTPTKTKKGPK
jgi:hypothetical protein